MPVRRATPEDARALAELHVASWRADYQGIVADELLAAQSVDQRHAMWDELLADEHNAVLVAGEIALDGLVAFEPETRHGYTRDGASMVHQSTGVTEVRMTRQTRE